MFESGLIFCFFILSCIALLVALFPFRKHKYTAYFIIFILLGAVSLCYWQWGGWSALLDYQQQLINHKRIDAMLKSVNGPEDLINQIKRHLHQQPNSAKGWYLLGRLYVSQKQLKLALDAFAKAHQLKPNNVQYTVNYAQNLFETNPALARDLLLQVLNKNPKQPDALAILAIDAYNSEAYERALDYWQHLLNLLSPDSEEAASIRKAMAACIQHKKHSRSIMQPWR